MEDRWPEELLRRVSQSVERQLGLHFPRERWGDLQRRLNAAAQQLGFNRADQCARWLLSAPLAEPQVELLASHLTVGETYFFRDPKAFEALEQQILPEIIETRRCSGKRLRIWSAGCCTGEEAYSLAIAVSRTLLDRDNWRVTVLGTDINPRFLQKAAAGVYGQWSFRNVPEETRARFLRPTASGRFEVLPSIRKLVTFSGLNLARDVFPALANNINAMDVIFCRNVLMYFSLPQAKKVVAQLHRTLVDGGWLFTGPTDGSREVFEQFAPAGIAGTLIYRKDAPAPDGSHPGESRRLAPPPVRSPKTAPAAASTAPAAPAGSPDLARRLASEGQLEEALAMCDRGISADKLDSASHYLRGMILQEQSAPDEAIASLKRALYLDPNLVVAHFALGTLWQRRARFHDAARCFANARVLLQSYSPEAPLPQADGITAGRLLAIIEAMPQPGA